VKVNEIFYSISGEGIHQGMPTTFVRFQGCNLRPRCSYCDTTYAWDPNGGKGATVEMVLEEVSQLTPYYNNWVCLTGGEPLWQTDALEELVRGLKSRGYKIEVETNGSLPKPRWWTLVDSWCADMKCPSSGVCGVSRREWFKTRPKDQVKFVVGTEEDLTWTWEAIRKHRADNPTVLVSPVMCSGPVTKEAIGCNVEWLQKVAEFCKEERVRFSLQWHKIVWGDKKGV